MASLAQQDGTIAEALAHGRRLLRAAPDLAAQQAREILAVQPRQPDALRLLAAALRRIGDEEAAETAELDAIAASVHDPGLLRAGQALLANDIPVAEAILRPRLKADPFDVAAIRMLAEVAARIGRFADAEHLLRRALELAPGFVAARANLATVLHRQNRPAEAIGVLDDLLGKEPDNPAHKNLKAAALGRLGGYEEAIALYAAVLGRFPDQPKVWMSYGHVLKTVGRQADCIAAYRRALGLAPSLGEAWWSLANLKTVRLTAQDRAAMEQALAGGALGEDDRFHLHFALAKALEDAGDPVAAFAHYAAGNRLRRAGITYDAADISRHVERSRAFFARELIDNKAGQGCPAPDPIFILGMPRAGSTLIEQILASHSQIEGTMELPDLPTLVKRLRGDGGDYPESLASLPGAELQALGEQYLASTRIQRKTNRPFFIDKMPNNWAHVGLIHLILPNARIVDARRHPLACCYSNFKQHFARGQAFTYDLAELGAYYRDYVMLMRDFDALLPGRVHRVIHEALIDDPEREVSRLLGYLDLPFEAACLRFHENERAVRTASSEQVRRPLNREGFDQWRPVEPMLAPLKAALGDVLGSYPDAPTA